MERYNPFASDLADSPTGSTPKKLLEENPLGSKRLEEWEVVPTTTAADETKQGLSSQYSTSFPDPLEVAYNKKHSPESTNSLQRASGKRDQHKARAKQLSDLTKGGTGGQRSYSVSFLNRNTYGAYADDDEDNEDEDRDERQSSDNTRSLDRSQNSTQATEDLARNGSRSNLASSTSASFRESRGRSGGRFTSFLHRATSVTSSSVTERVTEAVGSVRSAMDSISTQFQQAVPLNERLVSMGSLSGSTGSLGGGSPSTNVAPGGGSLNVAGLPSQQQQQQSSLTGNLITSSHQQKPLISRQRVVLFLDSTGTPGPGCDWGQQFAQYLRQSSSAAPLTANSSTSSFTSFFSAQFISNGPMSSSPQSVGSLAGGDLIEQASINDVSVLANQSSSTVAVSLRSGPQTETGSSLAAFLQSSTTISPGQAQQQQYSRIIRPEYVVIREHARRADQLEHLHGFVKALEYCNVPMFEPYDVWHTFQDRQLVFAKLLKVKNRLGKERFSLIQQVYCQTSQDLLNFVNNSSNQQLQSQSSANLPQMPYLVRTGKFGGKMRFDNLQMLRGFASIMATNVNLSCTIEQFLNVKCDFIVQKLGGNLKLFRRRMPAAINHEHQSSPGAYDEESGSTSSTFMPQLQRQTATRQTSLGSGMLSSLISTAGQQVSRRSSQPHQPQSPGNQYERVTNIEVNSRYREWMMAISEEFEHKLEAFSLRIIVASNDREYIVGLRNCSMDFLGSSENELEDRQNFVGLVLDRMNKILPKDSQVSNYSSSARMNESGNQQMHKQMAEEEKQRQQFGIRYQEQSGDRGVLRKCQQDDLSLNDASRLDGSTKGDTIQSTIDQSNKRSNSMAADHQSDPQWSSSIPSATTTASRTQSKTIIPDKANSDDTTDLESQRQSLMAAKEQGARNQRPEDSQTSSDYQRQSSMSQSLYNQTSSALMSLQRQSLTLFKRYESSGGSASSDPISNTRPLSSFSGPTDPKSSGPLGDIRTTGSVSSVSSATSTPPSLKTVSGMPLDTGLGAKQRPSGAGMKSQSMDYSSVDSAGSPKVWHRDPNERNMATAPPPRPPPPQEPSFISQSSPRGAPHQAAETGKFSFKSQSHSPHSLQSIRTSTDNGLGTSGTSLTSIAGSSVSLQEQPHSAGPVRARPNQTVYRQNSAASAFEPFDNGPLPERKQPKSDPNQDSASKVFDSASIMSSDSNDTTGGADSAASGAEDTMNNLKKTFASILSK